jgi:hypothetical protein
MKNKSAGAMFRSHFATISAIGSVTGSPPRRQIGSCGFVLARSWVGVRDPPGFRLRAIGNGALSGVL